MQAGQQITPTLRLQQLLGKGGMGSVWIADHLMLGTQVAVKFMTPSYVEDQSLVQRFQTEAMAAAQIKSPHIAQVFDHGFMTDGTPYIVMELLEGEDLKRKIRREGPLPLKDVAMVVSQASKALSRAHALNIVHRDIKPDNIFLCSIDGDQFI
jgi:eukaryotic-like serine/threonine-protein kinase